MSSDKTTSFDASTEWGGGTISSTKIQVRKSEPFREQHKRFVRTSRPSLQSDYLYHCNVQKLSYLVNFKLHLV